MDSPAALHPTDQTLHAYGLGKLDDVAEAAVDAHLEECPDCRRRVGDLSGDSFLDRMRAAGGPSVAGRGPSQAGAARPVRAAASAVPTGPELAGLTGYEIVRELGRGGMGVVYLARNTLLDRLEVLKVLNKDMLERRGVKERFVREMQAAARLNHANVVGAYAAITLEHQIVFAMEYVEGDDLAHLVKTRGKLPVAHACFFAHQAALGLQHAHERKMVHRDIKPGNLILSIEGQKAVVKVLDFGLAKATREDRVDNALTHEGQMLGTPDFIAPEQSLDAQKADIRADIYSLGCTLYYLLTGGPPFRGTSLYDVLQAHHSIEAKPLNLVRPEVPVALAEVVGKMMAKDPHHRYQTPIEAARALKPFFQKGNNPASGSAEHAVSLAGAEPAPKAPSATAAVAMPPATPEPDRPEAMWKSLIEFKEKDAPLVVPAPPPSEARKPWRRPLVAVAALLIGVLAVAAVVVSIRTKDGTIVLENVPNQAQVFVDGEKITIEWSEGEKSEEVEITVPPGKHGIEVKKRGFRTFGKEVTLESGGRTPILVHLEKPRERDDATKPFRPLPPLPNPPTPTPGLIAANPSTEGTRVVEERDDNALKLKLCRCPQGSFRMGSPPNEPGRLEAEGPVMVTLSHEFWLGKYEVTQDQWKTVMGTTIEEQETKGTYRGLSGVGPDHAMCFVSLTEAEEFCRRFTESERRSGRLQSDWEYRLPTEAQWEYACRAGTTTATAFGDQLSSVDANFNGDVPYNGAAQGPNLFRITPVGQYRPNPWGLHDMHGNVREWCRDGYWDQLAGGVDPPGRSGSMDRVTRGGSWYLNGASCRSAARGRNTAEYRDSSLGFRVARVPFVEEAVKGEAGGTGSFTSAGETGKPLVGKPPVAPAGLVATPTPQPETPEPSTPATATNTEQPEPPTTGAKAAVMKPAPPKARGLRPSEAPQNVTNSLGMKLTLIPAGEFLMGSDDDEVRAAAKPRHRVRITRSYYLGVTEVTQGQYRRVTADIPSHFQGSDTLPVEQVTWFEAVRFCNALSAQERVTPFYWIEGDAVSVPNWRGPGYRLPTDAEWEYACRAGSTTRFGFGDDDAGLGEYAWTRDNSGGKTHPVGQKRANAWGLFDMHGNVWEWCWDGFDEKYFANSPGEDPWGPLQASARVFRGGAWNNALDSMWSANREGRPPGFRNDTFGFRVARSTGITRLRTGRADPPQAVVRPLLPAPAAAVATADGFQRLFNGKDLTGWTVDSGPAKSWRVDENKSLIAAVPGAVDSRKVGFLLSDEDYSEFLLRFQFLMGPGSNSGLTFWSQPDEFVGRSPNPLQIELRDRDFPKLRTGMFFWSESNRPEDALPPDLPAAFKPSGEWNAMEVEVRKNALRVAINGRDVLCTDLSKLASAPRSQLALVRQKGRIGFEGRQGTVKFRDIEIQDLTVP